MNQEPGLENDVRNEGVKQYTWDYVRKLALQHKRHLVKAHIIALLAALISVPVPLLMPLLVDEVLLDKPGRLVAAMNRSEEHTSELQSLRHLVCLLLLEKKKTI